MWHKENLLVLCNDNSPQSSSLPSGKQNTPREYTESMEDGGGMTPHPDIILLDATPTTSTELRNLLKSYHESFPDIDHGNRPSSTKARKGVIYKPYEPQSNSLPSGKQNTPREYTESLEDGGGMTPHPDKSHLDATPTPSTELPNLLKSYHESFPDIDHGNRPSRRKARKGVVYEAQIVPQEEVDSYVQGISSSLERTDEHIEKKKNFRDKTCVCCLNNALKSGTINGSEDDCSKCCDTMQNGRNTYDSVSSGSDTAEAVNVSAADLTAQGGSRQNSSSSVTQDRHNSTSLDNTATSTTPLSGHRKPSFTPDAANGSPENLKLLSPSPVPSKDSNGSGYVTVVISVPLLIFIICILLLCKCRKE
jgi:hypothetical protein